MDNKIMTPSRFSITTLGCKVNQYESEAISCAPKMARYTRVRKTEQADICIINTCTVTAKASMQSRQAIRQAIKSNPDARIIVTGCYAHTGAEEIAKIDGVDDIIGNADKYKIPDMISPSPAQKTQRLPRKLIRNVGHEKNFQQAPEPVSGSRTRPFLKIQDGCNAFCTYCIVPHTRGRSRSMPSEDVLHHIQYLKNAGYHETVLTGIHLGCYGRDLSPGNGGLFELLKQIHISGAMERVRLSSVEPDELSEDIIALVAASKCLCHHFHIPFQSGDGDILKNMHRPYSADLLPDLTARIHRSIPDAAIGVDMLVGFPGETELSFKTTFDLIQKLPITYLHVFPFSPREGTPAAGYPDQVGPGVIKNRAHKMRELGIMKKHLFYQKAVGKTAKVLVEEKRDRVSGRLKGMTSNYLTILMEGPDHFKNTIVPVRIDRLFDAHSLGGTVLG